MDKVKFQVSGSANLKPNRSLPRAESHVSGVFEEQVRL